MKLSERLDEEAAMQEDDNKAWNLHRKASRERRKEKFLEREFKELSKKYDCVYSHPGDVCEIKDTDYGFIDFWPKSNTLRLRRKNKYIKSNALNWIKKRLLS